MADSAKAIIDTFLSRFGLQELGTWAWEQHLAGADPDQIFLLIREQPLYKQRFPAMEALSQMGSGIDERSYVEYETTVRQLLQQWGIVPGMYDSPEGIADLLVNRVSASEVNERLQRAAMASLSVPQEVRDALSQMGYELDMGSLASFYLDPDKSLPLIEQQMKMAQVKGAATQQQVGISLEEAQRLAEQGISYDQAREGFAKVTATRGLGAGQGETSDQDARVRAVFGDQDALEQVQRVQRSRRARFSGGGSAAESQEGVTGLGGAST